MGVFPMLFPYDLNPKANANGSTGPKSTEGKLNSRVNALSHGLAGSGRVCLAALGTEFLVKHQEYSGVFPTSNAYEFDLVVEIVFQELRKQQCRETEEALKAESQDRAQTCWFEDRCVEVEDLTARLSRQPGPVAARLRTTMIGREYLETCWVELLEALKEKDVWSDDQLDLALDLIGCDHPIRPYSRYATREAQLNLAATQRELLLEKRAEFVRLEGEERDRTIDGTTFLVNKRLRLVRRYLKESELRYDRAMTAYRASRAGASPPAEADDEVGQAQQALMRKPEPRSPVAAQPVARTTPAKPPEPPDASAWTLRTDALRAAANSLVADVMSHAASSSDFAEFVSAELEELRRQDEADQLLAYEANQKVFAERRQQASQTSVGPRVEPGPTSTSV